MRLRIPEPLRPDRRIVRNDPVVERLVHAGQDLVEIRLLAVLRQGFCRLCGDDVLPFVPAPCRGVQILPERLYPLRRYVTERDALLVPSRKESLKVLKTAPPVAPVALASLGIEPLFTHLLVVVNKESVQLVRRLEAEPLVLNIDQPLGFDRLGQPHGFAVVLPVLPRPLRDEVQLQKFILAPAIDIDVQIEALAASRNGALAKAHHSLSVVHFVTFCY